LLFYSYLKLSVYSSRDYEFHKVSQHGWFRVHVFTKSAFAQLYEAESKSKVNLLNFVYNSL